MSSISTAKPESPGGDGVKRRKDYLTTTEFARLCGVSRFTAINWAKQGKIRAVKTFGGHRRIPVSEAISFLEASHLDTFHLAASGQADTGLDHCWEYRRRTSGDSECGNCGECLVYGRQIDYCFVVARQFGKEVIRCGGDCLSCDYFEKFFGFYQKSSSPEDPPGEGTKRRGGNKGRFLQSFAYGVGRGVHELRDRVAGIRGRFARRPVQTDRAGGTRDV